MTAAGLSPFLLPQWVVLPLLAVLLAAVFVKGRTPFLLALSLLFFLWGNLSLKALCSPELPPDHIARFASDEPVIIEGVVEKRPEAGDRGSRILLMAERVWRERQCATVAGRFLLHVGEGRVQLLSGDRVRFASPIRLPRNYGLPGEFDHVRHLAFMGVHATGFARTPEDVILLRSGVALRGQRFVDEIATRMGEFIGRNVPREEGGVLRALLLGERGQIGAAREEEYARAGVNHILSISGFHVGIVAAFLFHLLLTLAKGSESLMLRVNMRRFALLLTLPAILFYLFLSGGAPATTRSVVMIAVYMYSLLLERESDPINSLTLAALVILALSPAALFDLSFQLSFLALWGIVVLTPLFALPFKGMRDGIIRKLLFFLAVSAAATVSTLVPVAYYFHRTTATGLVANFLIVPLMGYGAVILGFLALPFVWPAPVIAKALLTLAALTVKASNLIVTVLARLPLLPSWNPTRLDLLLFHLFLVALTFIKGRKARMLCCTSLTALFVCAWLMRGGGDDGRLRVAFFSLGQGEATLVTFPDGKTMLVDGGGSLRADGPDVGRRLLAPALWRLGVDRIDCMVLSHPHPDHLRGLIFVADNFSVGEFRETGLHADTADYAELKRVLARRRVPVRRIDAATEPFAVGVARIEPLAPSAAHASTLSAGDELNDDSLVFRLVYNGFSMLFTGDIGIAAEERLLARPGSLKCTVLKVPHHGSRYSSSLPFLRAASPEIALISAGYRNGFGLPHPQTIKRLEELGVRICRTDLDGTVQAVYTGKGCEIIHLGQGGHFR